MVLPEKELDVIDFRSERKLRTYLESLPKFYMIISKKNLPYSLFMSNAPTGYPSDFTHTYHLTKKEIETANLSSFLKKLMEFEGSGHHDVFFQDVHIVCNDIKDFFIENNPMVSNFIHKLFEHPEILYYVQHIPLIILMSNHFNEFDFKMYNDYKKFSLKKLHEYGKKMNDNRVSSLITIYEAFPDKQK